MSDHEMIMAIYELLDGTEWKVSMLSEIADMLTDNGYPVHDNKELGE